MNLLVNREKYHPSFLLSSEHCFSEEALHNYTERSKKHNAKAVRAHSRKEGCGIHQINGKKNTCYRVFLSSH
jgi:hypothetical protein